MRVLISVEAEREIEEIGLHIADDNPARAATFVAELIGQCEALGKHALTYPVAVDVSGLQLRRCNYRGYLIFYAVRDNVEIAHVFHGARDYLRLLFSDD